MAEDVREIAVAGRSDTQPVPGDLHSAQRRQTVHGEDHQKALLPPLRRSGRQESLAIGEKGELIDPLVRKGDLGRETGSAFHPSGSILGPARTEEALSRVTQQ